jgi:hypothetical protein
VAAKLRFGGLFPATSSAVPLDANKSGFSRWSPATTQQQIAMLRTGEQRSSLVTSGGNKVQISCTVIAMKFVGHE